MCNAAGSYCMLRGVMFGVDIFRNGLRKENEPNIKPWLYIYIHLNLSLYIHISVCVFWKTDAFWRMCIVHNNCVFLYSETLRQMCAYTKSKYTYIYIYIPRHSSLLLLQCEHRPCYIYLYIYISIYSKNMYVYIIYTYVCACSPIKL